MQIDTTPDPVAENPVTPPVQPPLPLGKQWLLDQSLAFGATLLGKLNDEFEGRSRASVDLLLANEDVLDKGLLSDSTLALIAGIDPQYCSKQTLERYGFEALPTCADALSRLVEEAKTQHRQREAIDSDGLNRLLISHAVYLMRRRNLTAAKFLKWLHRAANEATPGLKTVLAALVRTLPDGQLLHDRLNALLETSRDNAQPTNAALLAIDEFHVLLCQAAGRQRDKAEDWVTRLCIAYRSSLFCWPLLTESNGGLGLSLPIRLFLVEGQPTRGVGIPDPGGRVWFDYLSPYGPGTRVPKRGRRYRPEEGEMPAHIENTHFGFKTDWRKGFSRGLEVGKKLWLSQNGRLKRSDPDLAEAKQTANLTVDLHAACDIVDAVYGGVTAEEWRHIPLKDRFITIYDRSAEAYWTQCTLARLLPSADLPLAVCTGKIERPRGEALIDDVDGVSAKLTYANRIGVPRVVVPGDRRDYEDDQPEAIPDAVEDTAEDTGRNPELVAFLAELKEQGERKTMEVNFARSARAAADAMQPAGWRRMSFLRTPGFRWQLRRTQRRLVIHDALKTPADKAKLGKADRDWYDDNQWTDRDDKQMRALDAVLAPSDSRQVRHLKPHQWDDIRLILNGAPVENGLARWVAWKDADIRSPDKGWRGPGLGVLAMRTAEGDNHLRLWAALAELLDASEVWWDGFRASDRDGAADLLARLLCNRTADPEIGGASAPDLVILFDDAGLTTRRFSRAFASQFNHEFIDLLNPRATDRKFDYLEAALNRHGKERSLPVRLLIVPADELSAAPDTMPEPVVGDLGEDEKRLLAQLDVFRFGFSEQAGFAMTKFQPKSGSAPSWPDYRNLVKSLCDRKLLMAQPSLHLTPAGRSAAKALHGYKASVTAELHRHAAHALCPILYPHGQVVAANRDRQLEPESVLEASWHLQRAMAGETSRFAALRRVDPDRRPLAKDSLTLLTYMRSSPDWDTVYRLRINTGTRADSLDLCQELFQQRLDYTGKPPTPRSIGFFVETLGNTFRHEPQVADTLDAKAAEVIALVDAAMATLDADNPTPTERRRLQRYLFSRQLFALRMLGLSFDDPRLRGAKVYVDKAVDEILHPDFLNRIGPDREGLDDFPISRECWRALWSDGGSQNSGGQSLTQNACARYAYAAARATLARDQPDQPENVGWQEPWIAYFSLAKPDQIATAQLAGPLKTWWEVHSPSWQQALAFGTKVRNIAPHAKKSRKGKGPWQERWLQDINSACTNLWGYLSASDPGQRLFGPAVRPALRLINVMAMKEDLPAFHFLARAGTEWLQVWADPSRYGWLGEEWANLAKTVIGSRAGWAVMLAALSDIPAPADRLTLVREWLAAYRMAWGSLPQTFSSDPEKLLMTATDLPITVAFRAVEARARQEALALLNLCDEGQGMLSPEDLSLLKRLMPASNRT